MTDNTNVTYEARITLKLPGQPEAATVHVTLAPSDLVSLGGATRPLAECTLAELRAYGEALEADVWDAYQSISLLELAREEQLEIDVNVLDDSGQVTHEIDDWVKQAIVFNQSTAEQASSPAPDEENATDHAVELAEAAPTVEPPSPAEDELPAEAPPQAPIAESKSEPRSEPKQAPPTIIPSQARVRVAGRRLPLTEAGGAAVDILLDEAPLRAMQAHALSSLDREVAGVMIGRQPEKQPDGRYIVHIIDSVAAKYTVMNGASVTYTPESWRYLNDTIWERYPDDTAVMVGWYHTHPGFGIFLSGMDLFIHQNFFTQIWHIAYVLDPRARTSGFFCWNRQKTKVNRYDFAWPDWASGSW